MNRLTQLGVAVLLLAPSAAGAQVSKTIPGETRTMSATVEAIEASTRAVTVKKENGEYEVLYCPTSMKRCDTLKIGDKIKARYYETVVKLCRGFASLGASMLTLSFRSPGSTSAKARPSARAGIRFSAVLDGR